jgi:hypothetical protein
VTNKKATVSHPIDAEDDWRLHATARLSSDWDNPWTGAVVPTGTRLTVSTVVKLDSKRELTIPHPNAAALFLSASARAFAVGREIRDRSGIDRTLQSNLTFASDGDALDYLERMSEAVILAFTALEAFVNETIPDDYQYARHARSQIILEVASKPAIERFTPIDEKLCVILPDVLKCGSPRQSRCWSAYKNLKQCRDRLIHLKTADSKSSLADVDTIWKLLFRVAAPHEAVRGVVEHFAKAMENVPSWYGRFPKKVVLKK